MAHQTKKKRVDDQQVPADAGQRPVQLQRRRVWRACESCRRKKIKCDGNEPICSQCSTSGSQCVWLQTKDRAALSRHYVQELEARLLHMENIFNQLAPVIGELGQDADGTPILSLPQGLSISATNAANTSAVQQSAFDSDRPSQAAAQTSNSNPESPSSVKIEDDVTDSLGQLTLDEHGHMRWIGGSSTMSLIQSFRAATASSQYRLSPMSDNDPSTPAGNANKLYFPASVFFGKVRALPGPEEVEYPERDLADALVQAYFSKLHFLMPVLDKPSFMRQYEYLMDRTTDPNLARTETAFISLVFAVFACAAQLLEDPRLKGERPDDGGMGMMYYERALILHYISHASIQMSHVQCFVLMASFLCSVNCLPQAWLLIGQAVRMAQDLGYHRSPRRLMISSIEKETRRKLWWGVYTLDRMLALSLGRPLGIEDCDCDVELPVNVDDERLPEYFAGAPMTQESEELSLMTGFIYLGTLYVIAGRVMRQVYSVNLMSMDNLDPEGRAQLQRDVEILDKELTKWLDDLPVVFKSNPVNESQVSMGAVLCSHYYSVLTALHRNLLPVKRDQPIAPRSTAKAVSSARACIRLAPFIKNVVPPSHHLAFFIQHLFSSAVIILLYAMHVTDPKAADLAMNEAQSCLPALESWEGHWPGARKCKELLEELMATAREAIQSAQMNANTEVSRQSNSPASQPSLSVPRTMEDRSRKESLHVRSSSTGRPMKTPVKLNRNLSPDAGRASRQSQPSSTLRYQAAQRARSTSRKRGHDDPEGPDQPGPSSPYGLTFPLAFNGGKTLTSQESPTSQTYPSPPMANIDTGKDHNSGMMAGPPLFGTMNPPLSPMSRAPSGHSSFEFDFSIPSTASNPNPFTQQNADNGQWNVQGGHSNGNNGMGIFTNGVQGNDNMFQPTAAYDLSSSGLDSSFFPYDSSSSQLGVGFPGMGSIAPSTHFPAPGLPFRGLDFIRNFETGNEGYQAQDLGHGFDAGAFRMDPEIGFSLADYTNFDQPNGQ